MKSLSLNASRKMKKTSVGEIPVEWGVSQIGEYSEFLTSGSRGWSGYVSEFGACFIGIGELSRDTIYPCFETARRVVPPADAEGKRTRVQGGDLLISVTADLGVIGIVPKNPAEAYVSQHVALVRLDTKLVVPEFVGFFFVSGAGQKQFVRLGDAGAKAGLNLMRIRELRFPMPDRVEQQSIVEIIECWETAIRQIESLVMFKRRLKAGLMQQLLTGKRRFPAFGKKGARWNSFRMGELLKEVERPIACEDDKKYELISVRRRSGGLFNRETLFGREILTKNLGMARARDFLISKMQVVHGASGMVTPEFDGKTISGSYITLVVKNPKVLDMEFFNYLSQMPFMYHLALVSSYGVHIEKMTFNLDDYLHKRILIPPTVEEQRQIVEVLDDSNRELAALERELAALREQKKGLMQKLLTGKIRVKV